MSKRTPAPAPVAAIVLAAGLGTRMKSDLPKVLHPIAGRPMIQHLLGSLSTLDPERIVVVISAEAAIASSSSSLVSNKAVSNIA